MHEHLNQNQEFCVSIDQENSVHGQRDSHVNVFFETSMSRVNKKIHKAERKAFF